MPPPAPDAATRIFSAAPADDDKFVLTLSGGRKQEFTISKAHIAIGRAPDNDVVLADSSVSRRHARVEHGPQGYEAVDLGSANGISINGVRVARGLLKVGDVLGIGDSSFRFVRGQEEAPDVTRVGTSFDRDSTSAEASLCTNLEETALPRVVVLGRDRTWEVRMNGDALTIGSAPDNTVRIDSESVSRHHAVIERKKGAFHVRDLRSTNGTWVREQRVAEKALEDGELIRVGKVSLLFKRGFATEDLASAGKSATDRRAVVIVPGFAGSTLWSGGDKIWPSPEAILHPQVMRRDNPLEPRGLVDEVVIIPNLIRQDRYSAITNFLKESLGYESGRDLLEFGYDFRQDNRDSARRLAAAIEAWNVRGPITLIAHSMGCLVSRYYLECLGGRSRVERAVFLGGPHRGAPYAFATLLKGPDILPMGLMNARLRDVLADYPSWYQLLPVYECASDQRSGFEVLTDESWLEETRRPMLRDARRFRHEIGMGCGVPSVCIFGYNIKTITSVAVERDIDGTCRRPSFTVTPRGDGTIPEASSLLKGSEIHPVHQHHGSLHSDSDVKMRLKLELTRD